MSIIKDLKELLQQQQVNKPTTPPDNDGFSYISDAVVFSALYRAGVPEETIQEVLREPVEHREFYINYFESNKNDK